MRRANWKGEGPTPKGEGRRRCLVPSSGFRVPVFARPVFPFSGSNGEGPRPKGEGPRAKGEVCVAQMVRVVLDGTVAGRRRHGGLVPRNGAKKEEAATHRESLCGVAYLASWREIRLPRPHSSGRASIGGRRPLGNTPSGFGFRDLGETGAGKRETGGFELALRGRVARIALTRFRPPIRSSRCAELIPHPVRKPPPAKNFLAAWRT